MCTKRQINKHVLPKYTSPKNFFSENIVIICRKMLFFSYTESLQNWAKNLWFSMPTFEYWFEKFRINLSSSEHHVKNIEVKLVQKAGDFHTFYETGLKNNKFSEKFHNFQKEFRAFLHFKRCLENKIFSKSAKFLIRRKVWLWKV